MQADLTEGDEVVEPSVWSSLDGDELDELGKRRVLREPLVDVRDQVSLRDDPQRVGRVVGQARDDRFADGETLQELTFEISLQGRDRRIVLEPLRAVERFQRRGVERMDLEQRAEAVTPISCVRCTEVGESSWVAMKRVPERGGERTGVRHVLLVPEGSAEQNVVGDTVESGKRFA